MAEIWIRSLWRNVATSGTSFVGGVSIKDFIIHSIRGPISFVSLVQQHHIMAPFALYVTCTPFRRHAVYMGPQLVHHCVCTCILLTAKLDIFTSKFLAFDNCVNYLGPDGVIDNGCLDLTKSHGTSSSNTADYGKFAGVKPFYYLQRKHNSLENPMYWQ